jgi:hypothetical protein
MILRSRSPRSSLLLRGTVAKLVAAPATATVHTLTAKLKGVEEVPPNGSLALGIATVTLDDVANTVTVTGSYSGLTTAATLCHLHGPNAPLGVNNPPLVDLVVSGGTSGTISSGGTVSPADAQAILSGLTYVNVHNATFPGGEIRGQLLLDPPGVTGFCFGDGTTATACPCTPPSTVPSPTSAAEHGCANTFDLNGALLKAHGTTTPDNLVFVADLGFNYSAFAVMIASDTPNATGAVSGDGVLCLGGTLVKFGGHNSGTEGAPLGVWTYPSTAQTTPVSVATTQAPATTASYQLMYRNAAAGFCTPDTFNVTNGLQIPWP